MKKILFLALLLAGKPVAGRATGTIDTRFFLKHTNHPIVQFCNEKVPLDESRVINKFVGTLRNTSPLQLQKIKNRAYWYFRTIEPILKKYKIPNDFKFLPLIESGLSASAVSRRGAVGYWQFMPETARELGLRVTAKTDDRKHLVKSTKAACQYLRMLYGQFGSWTLVAAAYNSGQNKLRVHLDRQRKLNYYDLRLNSEAGNYLYKVLAVKEWFTNPTRFGELQDENFWLLVSRKPTVAKPPAPDFVLAKYTIASPSSILPVAVRDTIRYPLTVAKALQPMEKATVSPIFDVLRTQLQEAGEWEVGKTWVFTNIEDKRWDDFEIERGDAIYATVERIDQATRMAYLRTVRVYSRRKHMSYAMPMGATQKGDRLGILIPKAHEANSYWSVLWKRL